jgi:hypothetical protein
MSFWKSVLVFLLVVPALASLVRTFLYGCKFDRELERRYPDTVEQLKANYPSWPFRFKASLYSASFWETSIVKDDELRRLRRKAIFSMVYTFLFLGLVCLLASK